ncbi:hypothetical protein GCM10017771_78520 [Streptomyces capitiformicae]|uniref:Uncharacterized protein n=1 Tax=Streptomyces capitiformicae TaxID=2014920 RepID=A0A918ZK65_9ACTN|nr:hypothetical protein GCM10017771_78520 [Streptomyces capitiformicae]
MQPPRGDADVQVGGVRGERLQDMEQMQPEDTAGLAGHLQVGPAPQQVPRGEVGLQQLVEAGCVTDPVHGCLQRIVDRRVAGGEQGDGLVHGDGTAGREGEAEPLDRAPPFVVGLRFLSRHADGP